VASGCLPVGYHMASGWPRGGLGVALGEVRDAILPVPPKTAKSRPQPPKSSIESHLRFSESFRVHGPTSTSEFAAVSTLPPRNNSLCYRWGSGCRCANLGLAGGCFPWCGAGGPLLRYRCNTGSVPEQHACRSQAGRKKVACGTQAGGWLKKGKGRGIPMALPSYVPAFAQLGEVEGSHSRAWRDSS
jgi:hypothetical protein